MDFNKLFSGMADAEATSSARTPKIETAGDFIVRILECRIKESEQYNAVYFICEFEVLKSSIDSVKVGGRFGWTNDLTNKWYGLSNTKNFLAAALGFSDTSAEAKALGQAEALEAAGLKPDGSESGEQPFEGLVVGLRTQPKATKSGNEVTVHSWVAVPAEVAEEFGG